MSSEVQSTEQNRTLKRAAKRMQQLLHYYFTEKRNPEQWESKDFFIEVEDYMVGNPRDLICWQSWGKSDRPLSVYLGYFHC